MIGKNIGTPKLYQTMDLIPREGNWNKAKTKNIQSTRILQSVFIQTIVYLYSA